MVEATDGTITGTLVGTAYSPLQVQAGTERKGTLRTASTEGEAAGGDTVSISEEGRQKAAGMKSSGAGGTESTEKEDNSKLSAIKQQIQRVQEQIKEKQKELTEVQQDSGLDDEQRQQQMQLKSSELSMLQSQLMELMKQKTEMEAAAAGQGSSGGAAGVTIRA